MWSIIRYSIRSVAKNAGDYGKKYVKIEFNLFDELPLNKTIEVHIMTTVVRAVFHENNKYYPHIFFDKCLLRYEI